MPTADCVGCDRVRRAAGVPGFWTKSIKHKHGAGAPVVRVRSRDPMPRRRSVAPTWKCAAGPGLA